MRWQSVSFPLTREDFEDGYIRNFTYFPIQYNNPAG